MSADRYLCCDEQRRTALSDPAVAGQYSGIDYVEVRSGATTGDPSFIDIFLVNPKPAAAPPLTPANVALSGGTRFAAPKLLTIEPMGADPRRITLRIEAGQPTDFSTYRLSIVRAADNPLPPPWFDARLAAVDLSFKTDCPSDFDCAPDCAENADDAGPESLFDYRTRDYQGFRRLLLDRVSALVPGFAGDDPADLTVTLVEALAARADQLSYRLDWVGTEAFIGTARSRASIARHARLVDYAIGEGASARLFAQVHVDAASADGMTLAASTPLLVRDDGLPAVVAASAYARRLQQPGPVFETMAAVRLWQWRNSIMLHSWSDDECTLPKGACAATLVDGGSGASALAVGDFLLLAETCSPVTGEAADADGAHRHIVRIVRATPVVDVLAPGVKLVTVEWGETDALPFDLVIQARIAGDNPAGPTKRCASAAGNIVLADHGASLPPASHLALSPSEREAARPKLLPPEPIDAGRWQPRLDRGGIARVQPFDLAGRDATTSAQQLAAVDPELCRAALTLDDDFASWAARPDLLESTRYSRDFVVESGIDGGVALRFGDGVNGLKPAPGMRIDVQGRFGSGRTGTIGAGAVGHVVLADADAGARIRVSNPLAARGGADPEPVSQIRINAPVAFRRQERAVVADDYAEAAMRHAEVANAAAVPCWTGAWQTMLIYIDRRGGKPVDDAFVAEMLRHIEHFRLIGFDVAIRAAIAVPLDIELMVCTAPHALRSSVAASVRAALRPGGGERRGFFHPDNFSFGGRLYLSQLIAAAMAVDGVESVTARRFQRFGRLADGELVAGVIAPGMLEVLQLSDDPSFPEQGRLGLIMGGGR